MGADVYIDDSPDNIAALRAAGHFCVCLAKSANKGVEAPRARKWEEAYQLIRAKHPDPREAVR
jgi:5'-nucleotidase